MKSRIIAGAAAVVTLFAIAGSAQAQQSVSSVEAKRQVAATAVATVPANSVNTFSIVDKSIGGWDIKDNTIPWLKLGSDLRGEIRAAQTKAATATTASNTAATKADAAKATADSALAKANEALAKPDKVGGESDIAGAWNNVVIENAGGSWLTRNTKLEGEITVPAGKYTVHCRVKFTRLEAPAAGDVSRPQLAIRLNASATEFGADLGTVGGNDITPVPDGDLFGQCESQPWTVSETSTLTVHAFDYQDNRGAGDSGKIKVANAIVWLTAA